MEGSDYGKVKPEAACPACGLQLCSLWQFWPLSRAGSLCACSFPQYTSHVSGMFNILPFHCCLDSTPHTFTHSSEAPQEHLPLSLFVWPSIILEPWCKSSQTCHTCVLHACKDSTTWKMPPEFCCQLTI